MKVPYAEPQVTARAGGTLPIITKPDTDRTFQVTKPNVPTILGDADVYGAAEGRVAFQSAEATGKAINSASNKVIDVAAEWAKEQDKLDAQKAYVEAKDQVREFMYNPDTGLLTRQGEQALNADKDADQFFSDLKKQSMEKLGAGLFSGRKQAMFDKFFTDMRSTEMESVSRFKFQAITKQKDDTEMAIIAQAENSAADDPTNVDKVNQQLGVVDATTRSIAKRKGWSPEMTDKAIADNRSGLHSAVIQKFLADGNPRAADEYLKANKDDIQGEVQTKLESPIRQKMNVINAQDEAPALLSSKGLNGALKFCDTNYEGEYRSVLRTQIKAENSDRMAGAANARQAQGDAMANMVIDAKKRGVSMAEITKQVMGAKAPGGTIMQGLGIVGHLWGEEAAETKAVAKDQAKKEGNAVSSYKALQFMKLVDEEKYSGENGAARLHNDAYTLDPNDFDKVIKYQTQGGIIGDLTASRVESVAKDLGQKDALKSAPGLIDFVAQEAKSKGMTKITDDFLVKSVGRFYLSGNQPGAGITSGHFLSKEYGTAVKEGWGDQWVPGDITTQEKNSAVQALRSQGIKADDKTVGLYVKYELRGFPKPKAN